MVQLKCVWKRERDREGGSTHVPPPPPILTSMELLEIKQCDLDFIVISGQFLKFILLNIN